MEKNESSGGEVVQRVYSAIGGVPGAGESPRTAGWQVAKWLSSALLLLLLLLLQRSTEHKRASYFHAFVRSSLHLFIFFRFGSFFFYFRVELASRARWRRRRRSAGSRLSTAHSFNGTTCRRPLHLLQHNTHEND